MYGNTETHSYFREFFWRIIGILYAILVVAIGLSVTLFITLTKEEDETKSEQYLQDVAFMIMFASGIAVIIAFFIYTHKVKGQTFSYAVGNKQSTHEMHNAQMLQLDTNNEGQGRNAGIQNEVVQLYYVSYAGEGFTVYLKLGLGVFLFGSLAYSVINIVMIFLDGKKCQNFLEMMVNILEFFYVLGQSIFIYLNDGVIFLKHRALVRMGLAHLFTTNLCLWINKAIGEIKEGILTPNNKEHDKLLFIAENYSTSICERKMELRESVLPYLNPAVVEYALLLAPMMLELLTRVGNSEEVYESEKNDGTSRQRIAKHAFKKSKKGIIFSITAFILTAIMVLAVNTFLPDKYGNLIYISQDLVINIIGIAVCSSLFIKFQNLTFRKPRKNSFDDKLLVSAMFGHLLFGLTLLITILHGENDTDPLLTVYDTVAVIISLLQTFIQTVILLDGMRRHSSTPGQSKAKPGRSLVAAMVGINLALWLMDTFEIKKAHILAESNEAVSSVAIRIVLHICLPMSILFRFHSSVCFALIWTESYSLSKKTFIDSEISEAD